MRRKIMPETTKEEVIDNPVVEEKETKEVEPVCEDTSAQSEETEKEKSKQVPQAKTESSSNRTFSTRPEKSFQSNKENRSKNHSHDSKWDNDTGKKEKDSPTEIKKVKEEKPDKKKKDKKKKKKDKSLLGNLSDTEFSVTYMIDGMGKEMSVSILADSEKKAIKKAKSKFGDDIEIVDVTEVYSNNYDDETDCISIGLDDDEGDDEDAGLWESAFKD